MTNPDADQLLSACSVRLCPNWLITNGHAQGPQGMRTATESMGNTVNSVNHLIARREQYKSARRADWRAQNSKHGKIHRWRTAAAAAAAADSVRRLVDFK